MKPFIRSALFAAVFAGVGVPLVLKMTEPEAGPAAILKDPANMTVEQLIEELHSDPSSSALMNNLAAASPKAPNRYAQSVLVMTQQGWDSGLRGVELSAYVSQQIGVESDLRIQMLPDELLQDVIATRTEMYNQAFAERKSVCAGSIGAGVTSVSPEIMKILSEGGNEVTVTLYANSLKPQAKLSDADFGSITGELFGDLASAHGDAYSVFTGDTPLTEDNAADYCAVENDLFNKINAMPSGEDGKQEEYYRSFLTTLTSS